MAKRASSNAERSQINKAIASANKQNKSARVRVAAQPKPPKKSSAYKSPGPDIKASPPAIADGQAQLEKLSFPADKPAPKPGSRGKGEDMNIKPKTPPRRVPE